MGMRKRTLKTLVDFDRQSRKKKKTSDFSGVVYHIKRALDWILDYALFRQTI